MDKEKWWAVSELVLKRSLAEYEDSSKGNFDEVDRLSEQDEW